MQMCKGEHSSGQKWPKPQRSCDPYHELKRSGALLADDPCFPYMTKYNDNIYILLTFSFFFFFLSEQLLLPIINIPCGHLAALTLDREMFMHYPKY